MLGVNPRIYKFVLLIVNVDESDLSDDNIDVDVPFCVFTFVDEFMDKLQLLLLLLLLLFPLVVPILFPLLIDGAFIEVDDPLFVDSLLFVCTI